MKFLKIVLIFIAVFIVLLGILLFIALQTIKPEKIKALAEQKMSEALHRPTTINRLDLGLSLEKGLNFQAHGVVIKDLFQVDTVQLKFDAKRFMTKKEIVIPAVLIERPQIEWTPQSREGLPLGQQAGESQGAAGQEKPAAPETAEIAAFQINEILIKDGRFHYREDVDGRPLDVTVNHLNLTVRDFGLDRPFPYELNFGLMTKDQPLADVKGKAVILTKTQQLLVNDLDIRVLLRNLDLDELRRNAPEINDTGLKSIDDGELHFRIPELALGEKGLGELRLQGDLTKLQIQTAQIPVAVTTDAVVTADSAELALTKMSVKAGDGIITGTANVRDYAGAQEFRANVNLDGLKLTDLADLSTMDLKVRAKLSGTLEAAGAGFDEAALKKSLRGTSVLRVEDAKILDFNLLDYVLGQLPQMVKLGGLENNLFSGLRTGLGERYQQRFTRKDTVFEVTEIRVSIADGRLVVQETDFGADGYFVRAAGNLGLDGQLELRSEMFVSPEVSRDWTAKVNELSILQDAQGRIRIPFKTYRGPATKLGPPVPDLKDFVKLYYEKRGKEELKGVLRKALDLPSPAAPQTAGTLQLEGGKAPPTAPAKPGTPATVAPEDILIDALDGFLKKL